MNESSSSLRDQIQTEVEQLENRYFVVVHFPSSLSSSCACSSSSSRFCVSLYCDLPISFHTFSMRNTFTQHSNVLSYASAKYKCKRTHKSEFVWVCGAASGKVWHRDECILCSCNWRAQLQFVKLLKMDPTERKKSKEHIENNDNVETISLRFLFSIYLVVVVYMEKFLLWFLFVRSLTFYKIT